MADSSMLFSAGSEVQGGDQANTRALSGYVGSAEVRTLVSANLVHVLGELASSGDSFKIMLFSAIEGQEPSFQKGRVQDTALIRSPTGGWSVITKNSEFNV